MRNKEPKRLRFSDEELRVLVAESTSASDLMRRLGYKGRASKDFKKLKETRLDSLGLAVIKKPRYKHSDQQVLNAALQATSVSDCMRLLGVDPTGFAHNRMSKRLRSLGISFDSTPWNKGKKCESRPISDYLVLNGPKIGTSRLRQRLISEGIKTAKCDECGIENWQNKPISFHLDHINGNNRDNRFENLEVLCPNCHSQTPTYAKRKQSI